MAAKLIYEQREIVQLLIKNILQCISSAFVKFPIVLNTFFKFLEAV